MTDKLTEKEFEEIRKAVKQFFIDLCDELNEGEQKNYLMNFFSDKKTRFKLVHVKSSGLNNIEKQLSNKLEEYKTGEKHKNLYSLFSHPHFLWQIFIFIDSPIINKKMQQEIERELNLGWLERSPIVFREDRPFIRNVSGGGGSGFSITPEEEEELFAGEDRLNN